MSDRRSDNPAGSPPDAEGAARASARGGPSPLISPRANGLERTQIVLSCLCAVLIGILSLADIVLRAASVEFFIAGEANGILLAWLVFLALPYVTRTGGHISLDFLDQVIPAAARRIFRVFGYVVMLAYIGVLSWHCGQMTWTSWANDIRSSSILRWPVIYAQAGVMAGLGFLILTQCLILLRDIRTGGRVTDGRPEGTA